ncbi:hypothetical protein PR003_g9509 [Phytophthora rubi]|uniref:Uncharacterized protein n=1 Tax=Phytophthora rubi TaxID=129364 RepID=A0A6A3NKQ5_9STRA|nr:hypothetical protein PR001_g9859 [Phytophthora rubi]KAE9041582.1 hypothetical protein PR002_g4370 [Phytophthora rubi]KAE9342366.1 hypothetical protein PR003_g9509 [Phytophthora rubi]
MKLWRARSSHRNSAFVVSSTTNGAWSVPFPGIVFPSMSCKLTSALVEASNTVVSCPPV